MRTNGTYADHFFIQLTSVVLDRRIKVLHVKGGHTQSIAPQGYEDGAVEPIYLLYFEETYYGAAAHYQSIRPASSATTMATACANTSFVANLCATQNWA